MVQITISVYVLQMESKDCVTCIRCKIRWMEGYVEFESIDFDSLETKNEWKTVH